MKKKEYTLSVFIDLSKAFDVIDHSILIYKLKYYGVRGKCLKWFESYLSNRQQFTVVNGTNSNYNTVRCGVPQGSILGPLLFLIYVNDLPQCSQSLNYILFADDTSVFISGKDLSSLVINMNMQLTSIATWMEANKLILNVEKTNFMIFGTRRYNKKDLHLNYKDKAINHVPSTKFLGVTLDDKLSWKNHVNQLCNTISRNIGILRKLNFLPLKTLKMLYHSLISSHLNYCSMIWGYSSKSNLRRIHLLQKRAIRLITHSHYLHPSADLFSQMQILPIKEIVSLQTGVFMHNCYNARIPISLQDYFDLNINVHSYNTRSANNFHPPLLRTELSKSSLFYQGPILWNNLPLKLKLKSLKQFKIDYKSYLLLHPAIL